MILALNTDQLFCIQKHRKKKIIDKTTSEFQKLLSDEGYGEMQTLIKSLDEFYDAEEYHQDYIQKNPNGYCRSFNWSCL